MDSFAETTEDVPAQEETYYLLDAMNIFRPDGNPTEMGELEEFRSGFIDIMPGSDENGNLKVEVAEWTK